MINLRVAKEVDLASVKLLAEQTWPTAYRDIISAAQISFMLAQMYSKGELLDQVSKGHEFLIASELIDDVGFAGYALANAETQTYKLHKLYVLPMVQGKGVGRLLMNEVVERIRRKGGKFLQLNVNRANKAVAFYKKAGFEIKETVDLDIGNGFFMNDYVMEKPL